MESLGKNRPTLYPFRLHRNRLQDQPISPESLILVQANQIFIAKAHLPQPLANRLIWPAAFQNREFYKAQAMRLRWKSLEMALLSAIANSIDQER